MLVCVCSSHLITCTVVSGHRLSLICTGDVFWLCYCQYASASLSGEGVFGWMKHESGVHRVQRIPQTEASGRIHTSTMSVVILPQPTQVRTHAL